MEGAAEERSPSRDLFALAPLPGGAAMPDDLDLLGSPDALMLGFLDDGAPGGSGSQPAPAPARRLRCLDASHAPNCSLCTAAPSTNAEREITVLEASGGGLHGTRAALLLTPEWNCSRTREATAASIEAAGDATQVAPVLRAKASSRLSKAQVLALCAAWGYAHHAWRRRGDGTRKRQRTASGGDAPGEAAPSDARRGPAQLARHVESVLLLSFDAASVAQFTAGPLGGAVEASCGAMEGTRVRAVVEARRAPHCCSTGLASCAVSTQSCAVVAVRLAELQGAQDAWRDAASARVSADPRHAAAAAWQTLPLLDDAAPAEAAVALLRAAFVLARRAHADVAVDVARALPPDAPPPAVVAVNMSELLDGFSAGLRFAAMADAALAGARAGGDLAQYIALCDTVVRECARFIAAAQAAFVARTVWSRRVLQPGYFASEQPLIIPSVMDRITQFGALVRSAADAAGARGPEMPYAAAGGTNLTAALLAAR